ncbi:MAG: type I-G CRISPR-associated RAMP protein Csb1/Cas7g [Terriglobia bacterium]
MTDLAQFDEYLEDEGPGALVIREHLMPVEGSDGVLFPATFAAGDGFPGGYNIDGAMDGGNVCLIDSVGSQANRMEPLFTDEKYKALVPQIVVRAGEKEVNLLEAGHRAGDAIVRCSELQKALQDAFKAVLRGDAEPLAKIAPTSLVFGVWDSRDTQAKLPRLVASTVRAFNVQKLTRHAQFVPAVDYVGEGILEEPEDLRDAEGRIKGKHPFAQRGFTHVPVTKFESTHGGVIALGGVRRDATLGLAALRLLFAGKDGEKTRTLRRYILGLSLTAFTHNPSGYLRQGCLLVLDPAKPREFVEVRPNGDRKPIDISHEAACQYAVEAAKRFGVGESKNVDFDKERAKKDLKSDGGAKGKKGKRTDTTENS